MDTTEESQLKEVHKAFLSFRMRAEKVADEKVKETFVDAAPLIDILSTGNNQVFYGRRGTGKTHALKVVADRAAANKEAAVYLDLRAVGSNNSIYADTNRTLAERASQLLNDVFLALVAEFNQLAYQALDTATHPDQILLRLEDFESAIGSVRVHGSTEQEVSSSNTTGSKSALELNLSASPATASMGAKANAEESAAATDALRLKRTGQEFLHIDFGSVQSALTGLVTVLGVGKLWLLIDEWSEVPVSLQPFLADLFRRTILPSNNCVVVIAAIEHRSRFSIRKDKGEYVGIELGADMPAILNMDDFLVFDSNESKSVAFFKNLLFRHYSASDASSANIATADELIRITFTQMNVFAEFVRAIEGVPRDALSLLASIATRNFGTRIGMQQLRASVLEWFQREKAAVLRDDPKLAQALDYIIDSVIAGRKARAFLFPSNTSNDVIDKLFDSRVLHVRKRNVSSNDTPGKRYDVFKIDYGFYVDKINTNAEPTGLLEDEDGFADVPKDDYRSIRRAILKPEDLPAAN